MSTAAYIPELPELEDQIIEAVDEEGRELLRFATSWYGTRILIRVPRGFETWDEYCDDVTRLVHSMGVTFDDITLPQNGMMKVSHFTELAAGFLHHRKVGKRVEEIFFKYFEPEVEGCDTVDEARDWCRRNAPIDAAARLFVLFMAVEECVKKNFRYVGITVFRLWTPQQPLDSSTKSGESPPPKPESSLFSKFASYSSDTPSDSS